MSKSEFKDIFTALFNGNAGEARETVEDMVCDDFSIEEEWERQKQQGINYYVAYRHKTCYNK